MKKINLIFLLLGCIGFQSCKKNEATVETPIAQTATPLSATCYKALYENDTINLQINTSENGKVTGDMTMKIENMPEKSGKIAGEFHGDTLFVDYTFIQGTNTQKTFKNPMAMLKKGNELILGSGDIETYLGKSYFAKGKPIHFDNVKYKFTTVDCENK